MVAALALGSVLTSCIYEDGPLDDGIDIYPQPEAKTMLLLNIRPLDSSAESSAPVEMIRSLRIIIINLGTQEQPGVIELNKVVSIPEITATGLQYSVNWPTVAGDKQIYAIANESSAGADVTETLDAFVENSDPSKFIDWANNYYFEPDYSKMQENGKIYLPYTSYYPSLTAKPGVENKVTAYLVPVATKFIFNFYNKRDYDVNVNGVTIKSFNTYNYLNAQVGQKDEYKKLGDLTYFWIPWLAEVSKLSHESAGFSDNLVFNNNTGWITDYSMPWENSSFGLEEDIHQFIFVNGSVTEGTGNAFSVDGVYIEGEDEPAEPGFHSIGPFYLPESKNIVSRQTTDEETGDTTTEYYQEYYLTLDLEDTVDGKTAPLFIDNPLPNLQALFRNSYVIINVTFEQGDIEVYAQINPWNVKEVNGWLTEGNAPSPNPFASRARHTNVKH